MSEPLFLPSLAPIAAQYDAFILDLWGVIHDGQQLYPGVKQTLSALRAAHKKIIFLSNAPRRASTVRDVLARMGITDDLFDAIITSGETAYQCLAQPDSPLFSPQGPRYFYIGLEKDRRILDGLPYTEVGSPAQAQFLLLSHPYVDNQPMEEILPLLEAARAQALPALCINPDREVVRISGEHVYCAGLIAEHYERMGGSVMYFGKPHPAVYGACFALLDSIDISRILAVGDNPITDIRGANANHIPCALVTGGVLAAEVGTPEAVDYKEKCLQLCVNVKVMPHFILPAFTG